MAGQGRGLWGRQSRSPPGAGLGAALGRLALALLLALGARARVAVSPAYNGFEPGTWSWGAWGGQHAANGSHGNDTLLLQEAASNQTAHVRPSPAIAGDTPRA